MFTYIGTIAGTQETTVKGDAEIYPVTIPALYNTDTVSAEVLAIPGVYSHYDVGDVVLILDIDGRVETGYTYLIIGLFQTYGTIPIDMRKTSYEFNFKTGNMDRAVYCDDNPNLSIGYLLDTISDLKSRIVALEAALSSTALGTILKN